MVLVPSESAETKEKEETNRVRKRQPGSKMFSDHPPGVGQVAACSCVEGKPQTRAALDVRSTMEYLHARCRL